MYLILAPAEDRPGRVRTKRAPRQAIETLVYADLGPGNGGFPINVSEDGMAFQGIRPLTKDEIIRIKFKLPDTKDVVETQGQVVWLNALGKGGGLHFIELPTESRGKLKQWLSLQTQEGSGGEIVAVESGQSEDKKAKGVEPVEPPQIPARNDGTTSTSESKAAPPLQSLSPAVLKNIKPENKSAPEFLPPVDTSRPTSRAPQAKRSWLVPFTIGLATSALVMTVILAIFGVISIQFHWPRQTSNVSAAPALLTVETPKPRESPSGTAPVEASAGERPDLDSSGSKSSSTASAEVASPRLAASESSAAIMKVQQSARPRKKIIQPMMTAKPRPLNPQASAGSADFAAPQFSLETKPDADPRLPIMSSSVAPPPVALAASPAQKSRTVDPPQLISRIEPVYPHDAKATGISGSVELRFKINTDGKVRDVTVVKGNYLLARGALEALQAWRYQPAKLNGIPVEAESDVVFNFKPN